MFISSSHITVETIEHLEDKLDFYEMVSLVFLLYDNAEIALQRLIVAQTSNCTTGLLFDWVLSIHNKIERWQDTFLEAMCIIQSYAILRELGFDKVEMNGRFLPMNVNSSLFINPVRKALYRLCESMSADETVVLISYVKEDFLTNYKTLQFEDFRGLFLEMYILHWTTIKYLTLSENQTNNIDNILKVLKIMEHETMKESMLSVVNSFNLQCDIQYKSNSESFVKNTYKDNINNVNDNMIGSLNKEFLVNRQIEDLKLNLNRNTLKPTYSQHSVVASTSGSINNVNTSYSQEGIYNIDKNNVGICVIINQKNFYRNQNPDTYLDPKHKHKLAENELADREGTDIDVMNLKQTFEMLGFDIIIHENLPHINIISKINTTIIEKCTVKHSCLILCILSHGEEDIIYGADSVTVYVSDIEKLLIEKHSKLLGKPKIMIIQSCQGSLIQKAIPIKLDNNTKKANDELATDGPSNYSGITVPQNSDLLICWATVSGFASIRHKEKGTWFINSLCKFLKNSEEMHIIDILTQVIGDVSSKRWDDKCMVPTFRSTLTKKLYLPMLKND